MAERSFAKEVEKLKLGEGEEFRGEGILAVTKALLQSGVSYVGGYQGAPISHLLDVFADANPILKDLDVYFEASASEATACAMLAASVNYPLRGAVAWKSVVGTNVASDALSNIASGGCTGGTLVIVGEDYGEGSSIMQERTHAFAMKSQVWLVDPRPDLGEIVDLVEKSFELSEASQTPVMLELRIRACHMYGRFTAKDNVRPKFTQKMAKENPVRDLNRIVLPPANFLHEHEKIEQRWPNAVKYIEDNKLNEWFGPQESPSKDNIGIICQGGMFNTLNRALERLGLSDSFGNTKLPIYCMNVTYPMIESEVIDFCKDKSAVLMVEEGQPEFIEQTLNTVLKRGDVACKVSGKDVFPSAGEYTGDVMRRAVEDFLKQNAPDALEPALITVPSILDAETRNLLAAHVPLRPAGFCTGCPERPIFTAMKLVAREIGEFHVSCDIGCHLFSILPPFNIGNTTMGYGLGAAGGSALNVEAYQRSLAVMGDGGFWHNGLTSGVGNAVFNNNDNVLLIVDNNYSAATGGQDILSSRNDNDDRSTQHGIADAAKGVGVKWIRQLNRTYDVKGMKNLLKEAMTTTAKGPKVIIAQSECMLNRQRREKPLFAKRVKEGKRAVRERFGVDPDTCTGDHSCIRLSGCPSLTIKPNPDPLRQHPIAHVDNSCVGCGLCGEVSHAAVLCPSFYRAEVIFNDTAWDRFAARTRQRVIGWFQDRRDQSIAARSL
ncbi:MAG: indolepyruvate ferredoxin oxidoreductase subunit alpha [Pseudomonadota bacterium]